MFGNCEMGCKKMNDKVIEMIAVTVQHQVGEYEKKSA